MSVIFFVLLLIANTVGISLWINGAKSQSHELNLAGRQRMLTQKMTKEAILKSSGVSNAASLSKTILLFDDSLEDIIRGSQELNLQGLQEHAIIEHYELVNEAWTHFKKQLESVNSSSSSEALQKLSQDSISLLELSNQGVKLLEKKAQESISKLRTLVIVFAILGIISGIIVSLLLTKYVLSPLERVRDISNTITSQKNLTLRIALEGNTELDEAAHAFDEMLDSFVDMNRSVKEVDSDLQQQVKAISVRAERNKTSAQNQASELIQASSSMAEMTATVEEIANNTQSASNSANKLLENATTGRNILYDNIKITSELAQEIHEASSNIERLARASSEIGGIADTISTIAEQTNLLALNAAIEAARAGEQGRGFAVVADEVRTLAQKTQSATSQIHAMIDQLSDATEDCVTTMDTSKQHSEHSVSQSERLQTAFDNIIESVQTLTDINQQIAVSTEQQSIVANEMNTNFISIENQSKQTAANAEKANESVQTLQSMSQALQSLVTRYQC